MTADCSYVRHEFKARNMPVRRACMPEPALLVEQTHSSQEVLQTYLRKCNQQVEEA